jgi:bile acid:Na+ symporter, BASS family
MRSAIQEVFKLLLALLIPLAAFTTGLRAPKPGQPAARLWRQPAQLFRDLLAILILVPLWAIFLVRVLPVSPLVRGGLLIAVLAVGIGPAAGMKRMGPRASNASEALDLNMIVLVLSLIFVPIGFALVAAVFHRDLHVGAGAVAKVVLGRAVIPLLLGLGAARLSPRLAEAAGPWLTKIINVVLVAVVAIALLLTGKRLAAVGGVGWLVAAAVAVGAVVIGHVLGGPNRESRAVVAVASAMRFPALALVLAAALPRGHEVIPVILVYVLAAFVATTIYSAIMARRRSKSETPVVPIGAAPRRA